MKSCIKETTENQRSYPYNLITDYFYRYNKINEETPYELLEIYAKELIKPERIDLAIKYYYIECRETGKDLPFAEELYAAHIDAFSDGIYREFGSDHKNSLERYRETFCELIDEIKKNGFDASISLIPVGKGDVLLDGAHRVACAAYFNQKVKIIRFHHLSVCYDYSFFRKHLLEERLLELAVRRYLEIKDKNSIYLAYLWPKAYSKRKLMHQRLQEQGFCILYHQTFRVTYEKLWELVYQIYQKEKWIGSEKNKYWGIADKTLRCYEKHGWMEIILFEGADTTGIKQVKEEIRLELGLGKSSFHTTDCKEETVEGLEIYSKYISGGYSSPGMETKIQYYRKRLIQKKIRYLYTSAVIRIKKVIGMPV